MFKNKSILRNKKQILDPYWFILPAMLLLSILMLIPIIQVFRYSLMDNVITNKSPEFVGLSNYKEIIQDEVFKSAIGHTLFFTIFSVVFHLILGMSFALLLNSKYLGSGTRAVLRVIFIFPWLFTPAIIAIVWRLILDPLGIMNFMLQQAGLIDGIVEWLSDESTALGTLTFINVWNGYPFYMVSLLAGLQSVPQQQYEAAVIDGANSRKQFYYITIPHLKPIILSLSILDFIWTMQVFPLVWMTTGGGPGHATEVMATYTYKLTFLQFEFSKASASAMIILLISMVISIFYVRSQKSR
jgi:multiple sugar transport system permease protein